MFKFANDITRSHSSINVDTQPRVQVMKYKLPTLCGPHGISIDGSLQDTTAPLISKGRRSQSIAVLRGPDVHLVAIQVCRAALFGSGIAAALACLSSTVPGARQRLQCALSAAVCAISSMYYANFYSIRKRPLLAGYTLAGNAAVDALRYASWSASIALLACNALLFRGPFGDADVKWLGLTYKSWLATGPLLAAGSVLLGIPGWHSARSSSKDASCSRVTWLVFAALFLLLAVVQSMTLAYTIQFAPFGKGLRTRSEIQISRVMSALWFVYPLVSCMRTLGMMIAASQFEVVASMRRRMPRLAGAATSLGFRITFAIQKAFSTFTMAPMDLAEYRSITEFLEGVQASFDSSHMTPSPVPIWITQLSDFTIAIVDIVTQVYTAVACVAFALPVT